MLGVGEGLLSHPHLCSLLTPPGTEERSSSGKICLFQRKDIGCHFTLPFCGHPARAFPEHDTDRRASCEQSPSREAGDDSGGVLCAQVFAFVNLPEWPDKLSPGSPVGLGFRQGIFCLRNIPIVPITLGTGTLNMVRTGPAEADSPGPCSWSPREASQRLALSARLPVSDAQTHPHLRTWWVLSMPCYRSQGSLAPRLWGSPRDFSWGAG